MYKAIFIDIDDTLRNSNKQVSKRTIKSIKNITKKGILVILCSGRPRRYTEDVSKECFASKYIIACGGADIYDYQNRSSIYTRVMDKNACKILYDIAIKSDARIVMHTQERRITNKLKYTDRDEEILDSDIKNFLDKSAVVQCIIIDEDFEKIENLKSEIELISNVYIQNQAKCLSDKSITPTNHIYYDIADTYSSKGNGIIRLCEYLNINIKDTIAIGDGYNDISMFEVAGYSVVMGNANDEIKKYADEVIETNDNDGVAIFLEKIRK